MCIRDRLKGKFKGKSLETVDVIQNTEMVYYLYDDKAQELTGIDKAICSALRLDFVDSGIEKITFFTNPDGVVYPQEDLPKNTRQLLGFTWREDERINCKEDLFHGIDLENFSVKVKPVEKKGIPIQLKR